MNKNSYKCLLILLLFAFANLSVSVPIRCASVSVNALEYEETSEDETILDAADLELTTVDCGGKDVCQQKCKCGKRIFYHDILTVAKNEKERKILGEAYLKACIRRKWQNDNGDTNELLGELMKLLKERVSKDEIEGVDLKKDDWGKIREGIMSGGKKNNPWQFLIIVAELLFTYKKNCAKNGEWRNDVNHDIQDIMNYGPGKIKKRFKQNEYLKNYFLEQINKFNDIQKKMGEFSHSKDTKRKKIYSKFKNIYVHYIKFFGEHIKKEDFGDTMCKCSHLAKYKPAKKIFDKLKLNKMISKACDHECKTGNSLSTAGEEQFFFYE
eukprot:gene6754-10919_t